MSISLLRVSLLFLPLFFLLSCHPFPKEERPKQQDKYFVIFLVKATGIHSISQVKKALNTNPKEFSYGHAWFLLKGVEEGKELFLEGGHSGELGLTQAKYLRGVSNYLNYGYANPDEAQKKERRYEKNPIKYLWEPLYDGFFQKGSGGHKPSYAAYLPLSRQEYEKLKQLIENYPFLSYSLQKQQCCQLIVDMAAALGHQLEAKKTLRLPSQLISKKESLRLWSDPSYAYFTFLSPDTLQQSLKKNKAFKDASYWYHQWKAQEMKEQLP